MRRTENNSSQGADSGFATEAAARLLVSPKKPKFTSPFKQPSSEPFESGSPCSSPSVSGFIIAPSRKLRRAKKKTTTTKSPASKVFTDDDVISLLNGLAAFWAEGRNNKWAEFHHFVKGDLVNQYTKTQVSEKIRNLKKKFDANSERARENGGQINLPDPHESTVFELSKALWGDERGIAQEKGGISEFGDGEVVENDEGSKSRKKKKKKRKQVCEHGEENKKMRKEEHGIEQVLEEGNKVDGDGDNDGANAALEEGDVHEAANTILSIRKLVESNGEESKKTRKKKKRNQGDGHDEKKELVTEEVHVEGDNDRRKKKKKKRNQGEESDEKKEIVVEEVQKQDVEESDEKNEIEESDEKKEIVVEEVQKQDVEESDEGNKISSKQKQVDGNGERTKKARKTKLVDECVEVLKEVKQADEEEVLLKEGKQVEDHEQQVKKSKKQRKRVDCHDVKKDFAKQGKQEEEEELLEEGKQVDEHEQDKKSKKQKRVDGHDEKQDMAKQGKQVDDHLEELYIPVKRTQKVEIGLDDFQSAYPLLYASFSCPKVAMNECILIGRENAQKLEENWRELKAKEHHLELKILDLMNLRGK